MKHNEKKNKNIDKKRNLLLKIGLLIFSLLVYFLVFEIILRVYSKLDQGSNIQGSNLHNSLNNNESLIQNRKINFSIKYNILYSNENNKSDIYIKAEEELKEFSPYYIFEPNSSFILGEVPVYINSLGIRDRDYNLTKPKNTYRIVVIGDSFTFGYGILINETYVKQLERMLSEKYPNVNIEVLNCGFNGATTFGESIYLEDYAIKFNPDLVLVGFFINDAEFESGYYGILCKEKFKDFNKNKIHNLETYNFFHDKLVAIKRKIEIRDSYENSFAEYFLSIYDPNSVSFLCMLDGIKRFKNISSTQNLDIIFIIIPSFIPLSDDPIQNQIYENVEFILKENDIIYYDSSDNFLKSRYNSSNSYELYTKVKPKHFNYIGNKIIAEGIYDFLVNHYWIEHPEKSPYSISLS